MVEPGGVFQGEGSGEQCLHVECSARRSCGRVLRVVADVCSPRTQESEAVDYKVETSLG